MAKPINYKFPESRTEKNKIGKAGKVNGISY
jgi:hypothetical protein